MDNNSILLLIVLVFLVLAILGTPVAFALFAGVLVGAILADVSLTGMVGQLFNGVNSSTLLAVPFFLLVAELMNSSGIVFRLIRLVQALVGHIRSGLAQVNALFSMLFAGISGSSTADVAANARILLPAMKKEGYEPASSAALIAAASTIANMIPPSILAIVYGAVGGVSITGLFLGGATPGVLVGVGLMAYSYFFVKSNAPPPRAKFREIAAATRASILPLMVPVIILGGILAGQFTPTEAGMIAAVYTIVLLVPLLAWRRFRHLPKDFVSTGILYSLPLIAVAAASAFAWLFAYLGGARVVSNWVLGFGGGDPIVSMVVVVAVLVIAGQFIDPIPAIVLFMPIIVALTKMSDINPVQMGVVVIVTLAFGMITPPYGLSLLLATSFANVSFFSGVRKAVPIYAIYAVVIGGLVLVPELSLWLPKAFVPQSVGCFPGEGGEFVCP